MARSPNEDLMLQALGTITHLRAQVAALESYCVRLETAMGAPAAKSRAGVQSAIADALAHASGNHGRLLPGTPSTRQLLDGMTEASKARRKC